MPLIGYNLLHMYVNAVRRTVGFIMRFQRVGGGESPAETNSAENHLLCGRPKGICSVGSDGGHVKAVSGFAFLLNKIHKEQVKSGGTTMFSIPRPVAGRGFYILIGRF